MIGLGFRLLARFWRARVSAAAAISDRRGRCTGPAPRPRRGHRVRTTAEHRGEVIGAEKVAPHADRRGGRGDVERQRLLDLVQQVERVAGLAVELVCKSDDRHVAQPADLEELAGLLLDTPLAPLGAALSAITALSTAVSVR